MKWNIDEECTICAELHDKDFNNRSIKQICEVCEVQTRILYEDKNFVIIPSLGPISDCHILLVPKQHVNSYALLSDELLDLAERLIIKILKIIKRKYGSCIIFEHGVLDENMLGSASCNHAHIHIVSCNKSLLPLLERESLEIRKLEKLSELVNQTDRNEAYFYYSEDGEKSFIMDDTIHKSQYMRMITAEILKIPERGNWKQNLGIENVQKMLWDMKEIFVELSEPNEKQGDERVSA